MSTFVVSDIHGNFPDLWSLLYQEGLVDDEENRTALGEETFVVSVGDLLYGTLPSVTGDELCASVAKKWFDKLIVGNHEWPYLYDTAGFSGYHPHPPLRMLYNQWKREGFVVPAVVIGDTLVSHAGWAFSDFDNAHDTYKMIKKVWDEYPNTDHAAILDAVGYGRGGPHRLGGILWSDWEREPKNKSFSQVVGHTPNVKGPRLHEREDGTFTLCIDTACGKGGVPTGVWLDDFGKIIEVISLEREEGAEAPSAA